MRKAHHVALLLAGIPLPDNTHVCRHLCNNSACVNVRHIKIGTQRENMDDLGYSGVMLTAEDVRAIKANTTDRHQDIATRYGVARSTVSLIKSGRRWSNIT